MSRLSRSTVASLIAIPQRLVADQQRVDLLVHAGGGVAGRPRIDLVAIAQRSDLVVAEQADVPVVQGGHVPQNR